GCARPGAGGRAAVGGMRGCRRDHRPGGETLSQRCFVRGVPARPARGAGATAGGRDGPAVGAGRPGLRGGQAVRRPRAALLRGCRSDPGRGRADTGRPGGPHPHRARGAPVITVAPFGVTTAVPGRPATEVQVVELTSAVLTARLLTLGAAIASVDAP